jgi:hypothetical protein
VGVGPVETSISEPAETAAQHKHVRNSLRILLHSSGVQIGQRQCGKKAYQGGIAQVAMIWPFGSSTGNED